MWAYVYEIVPPQAENALSKLRTLLDQENAAAERGGGTWVGRLVLEQGITRILIVSDSPQQDREVNRRLEAALKQLEAGFSITVPMALPDDAAPA